MTEPLAPAPASPAGPPPGPPKPSFTQRLLAFAAWARSPKGRHDLGALVAAGVTVYTALHRAGV